MTIRKLLVLILSIVAAALASASTSHALLPPHPIDVAQVPSTIDFVIIRGLSKCTAVKVAPKVFLTAAHCFRQYNPESDISLEQVSKRKLITQVRTQITKLEVHPGYRFPSPLKTIVETTLGDLPDIAMFKTKDDVNVPAAKINFDRIQPGQKILIGGYGEEGKNICHGVLHPCSLSMAVKTIAIVKSEFFITEPTREEPYFLTPGDSGGPAYIQNQKTKQLEVVGINSMMVPLSPKQLFNMATSSNPPKTSSMILRISEQEAWYVNILRELTRDPREFDIEPINPTDLKILDDAPGINDKSIFGN